MEVIKSAGVYNCHIDDLYKSAEPAEALNMESLHKEFPAHLQHAGRQQVSAGVPHHPQGCAPSQEFPMTPRGQGAWKDEAVSPEL